MKALAIAFVALAAGSAAVAPSDLLVAEDVPDGFELVVEPPADLTFDEYAELSPDVIADVDPDSEAARSMRAAVDVWASTDDDILLREVTRWATEEDAGAFVAQAIVVGVQSGLARTDPPLAGGVAYLGADDGLWTRTVTWQQGSYAMSVAHFAVFQESDAVIDEAVVALAERVAARTGRDVAPAPDGGESDPAADEGSGGGITIGTVLVWIVVIAGVTWLIMRLRRRAAGLDDRHAARTRSDHPARDEAGGHGPGGHHPDERDVDGVIERARPRNRVEREVDAIADPTDPGWRPPGDA